MSQAKAIGQAASRRKAIQSRNHRLVDFRKLARESLHTFNKEVANLGRAFLRTGTETIYITARSERATAACHHNDPDIGIGPGIL
ncbi:plasmid stabilization system protein ParE [Variovorax sp. Sphag1AA]|nr:hypothetical protein [Variovorax sp. Sphag1AA]MBB3181091.1 plasmid stabilization system protein ParE [Variovorax sp. Sphag1AA]